tara:strand:+ start:372 stop:659 length:288 start_codon:yes stop_codon:yes gene_type:complete
MSIPLTRERVLEIIAEEKQNLQDDLCNSKKHSLGKKADLISKGLRVCCKKSDKEYYVAMKKNVGKNKTIFILVDPEGNRLDPMPAEQLLKDYRLD